MVIPTTSSFNPPLWPVQKTDGPWRMTVNYPKPNQVVTPTAAAVPDVVSLLEHLLLPAMQLLIWQMLFFFILVHKDHQKQSAFSWQGQQYTFMSFLRAVSTPSPCHSLVLRDLDHLSLPQGITLVHCIADIMLIGPAEQEVATTLNLLVEHLHIRVREINPLKFRGLHLQ